MLHPGHIVIPMIDRKNLSCRIRADILLEARRRDTLRHAQKKYRYFMMLLMVERTRNPWVALIA